MRIPIFLEERHRSQARGTVPPGAVLGGIRQWVARLAVIVVLGLHPVAPAAAPERPVGLAAAVGTASAAPNRSTVAAGGGQEPATAPAGEKDFNPTTDLVRLARDTNRGDARLDGLDERLERLIQARELFDQAENRYYRGSFQESLALIEKGLALFPGHPQLEELQVRVLRADARHKQARAHELMLDAQAAYVEGDFARSMQMVVDGLWLTPENAELKALEAELQHRLDEQRALRETANEARRLTNQGELEAARRLLDGALESHPGDSTLTNLRARIEGLPSRTQSESLSEPPP